MILYCLLHKQAFQTLRFCIRPRLSQKNGAVMGLPTEAMLLLLCPGVISNDKYLQYIFISSVINKLKIIIKSQFTVDTSLTLFPSRSPRLTAATIWHDARHTYIHTLCLSRSPRLAAFPSALSLALPQQRYRIRAEWGILRFFVTSVLSC